MAEDLTAEMWTLHPWVDRCRALKHLEGVRFTVRFRVYDFACEVGSLLAVAVEKFKPVVLICLSVNVGL